MLARALVADPDVLVLDEPTSAVDAHTEARIAERLQAARAGRTTVVMTTSPLMLERCDEVAFLDGGTVVDVGSAPRAHAREPALPLGGHPRRERPGRRWARTGSSGHEAHAAGRHRTPDPGVRARRCSAGTRARSTAMLVLHALAAVAGLAGPRLLGALVQSVQDGTTTDARRPGRRAAGRRSCVAQTVLTRWARSTSFVLGEQVLADLREDFLDRVLRLPLSTVERAGTGDLLTRTTSDVDALARTVRFAVPETMVAAVTTVLTLVATFLVVAAAGAGLRWPPCRSWCCPPAGTCTARPAGYLAEREAYSVMTAGVTETAEGARTVEALRLADLRIRQGDADVAGAYAAERRTLFLRTVWFPTVEVGVRRARRRHAARRRPAVPARARSRSARSPRSRCTCSS